MKKPEQYSRGNEDTGTDDELLHESEDWDSEVSNTDSDNDEKGDGDEVGIPLADSALDSMLRHSLLSHAETVSLIERWQKNGDEAARDKVILHNLRWVLQNAYQCVRPGINVFDLFQEGIIGLIKAIDQFDCSRGTKLTSYSRWKIRQRMQRSIIDDENGSIRVPVHIVGERRKIARIIKDLSQELDHEPSEDEIIEHCMKRGIEDPFGTLAHTGLTLSLDEVVTNEARSPGGERTRADIVGDANVIRSSVMVLAADRYREILSEAENIMQRLRIKGSRSGANQERDCKIFENYYGLDGSDEATLDEIGKKHKVTRERIRQICVKCFRRLNIGGRVSLYFLTSYRKRRQTFEEFLGGLAVP